MEKLFNKSPLLSAKILMTLIFMISSHFAMGMNLKAPVEKEKHVWYFRGTTEWKKYSDDIAQKLEEARNSALLNPVPITSVPYVRGGKTYMIDLYGGYEQFSQGTQTFFAENRPFRRHILRVPKSFEPHINNPLLKTTTRSPFHHVQWKYKSGGTWKDFSKEANDKIEKDFMSLSVNTEDSEDLRHDQSNYSYDGYSVTAHFLERIQASDEKRRICRQVTFLKPRPARRCAVKGTDGGEAPGIAPSPVGASVPALAPPHNLTPADVLALREAHAQTHAEQRDRAQYRDPRLAEIIAPRAMKLRLATQPVYSQYDEESAATFPIEGGE